MKSEWIAILVYWDGPPEGNVRKHILLHKLLDCLFICVITQGMLVDWSVIYFEGMRQCSVQKT